MHPNQYLGNMLAYLSMIGSGLLREVKPRTDADRLKDLDRAEEAHIAKITNPTFIAAQAKRERKRLSRINSN